VATIYTSVSEKDVLAKANGKIFSILKHASNSPTRSRIVFRPDHRDENTYWNPREKFWFASAEESDHYWFPLGLANPAGGKSLRIALEVNTPTRPKHGRAGLILRDGSGKLYLAHTGRVGGGVKGVNRDSFLAHYSLSRREVVTYDDGKIAILLGDIEKADLVENLASYVHEVAEFKKTGPDGQGDKIPTKKDKKFRPKFIGTTKRKARGREKIRLFHDLVCEALNCLLPKPGGHYNKQRDLYLRNKDGSTFALFEVKTDCSTTSVYTGLGQLLINGHRGKQKRPHFLLVVPGVPDADTKQVLNHYGVSVISYKWRGDNPVFADGCVPNKIRSWPNQD
jgi:hypothetical protein